MENLLSAGANEKDKFHNNKDKIIVNASQNKPEDKECQMCSDKMSSWLSERATTAQVCQLAKS